MREELIIKSDDLFRLDYIKGLFDNIGIDSKLNKDTLTVYLPTKSKQNVIDFLKKDIGGEFDIL
jgi:hypothetical protein